MIITVYNKNEVVNHPYYIRYQKMRNVENDTFTKSEQTLLSLICWDIKITWFKLTIKKQKQDFIKKFGEDALPD